MIQQLLLGVPLAIAVSYLAYRLKSLTAGGALAAAGLGTIVFGLGGWQWAVVLITFFTLSSALTRAFASSKDRIEHEYEKGSRRDQIQVLSNGGLAGAFVIAHAFMPGALWPWIGFAGAIAAVNADTWATELGVLNPGRPRLITSLSRQVERGTSGGVSFVGTLASLLAAASIGALAGGLLSQPVWLLLPLVALAGLLGSLVDSLLGATLQAMYYCLKDHKETEKHPLHTCGTATVLIRGWKWLNNDWVNVLCSLTGAISAEILVKIFLAR